VLGTVMVTSREAFGMVDALPFEDWSTGRAP
jgi:hypothetical protein